MDNNKIDETKLEGVTGGFAYANGNFVNYGNYIIYTVAQGDVLSGIGVRFNVSVAELQQWNDIRNPDLISVGQRLTIYPRIVR